MRIAFHNLAQGIAQNGEEAGQYCPDVFSKLYESLDLDLLCLAETPFDDKEGTSEFVSSLAAKLSLPYTASASNGESWLLKDKWYGLTTLSRWKITERQILRMTNPDLCTTWNGIEVRMHDKFALSCTISHPEQKIQVINFHGFPFHRFGQSIANFPLQTKEMEQLLMSEEALVVCGDFNNSGIPLKRLFAPLFSKNGLQNTVRFSTEDFFSDAADGQIDHIICSKHFETADPLVNNSRSDHPILTVTLTLKDGPVL